MFIVPSEGLTIPDPDRRDMLPAEGREVPETDYWHRRLFDGDVRRASAPPAEPAEPT